MFRRAPELEVLLLERAGGGLVGEWCPVAGRVERGELPRNAARREALEEIGIDVGDLGEPATAWTGATGPRREPIRIFVFAAHVSRTATVVLNYEHSDFKWLPPLRALELLPLRQQRRALELVLERHVPDGQRSR